MRGNLVAMSVFFCYNITMFYALKLVNLSGWILLAFIVAYILAVMLAIVFHEFSHAYVATKFGDPTPRLMGRLSLNPAKHFDLFGFISFFIIGFGWAKPVIVNPLNFRNFRKGQRFVALAGVTTNLVLCILFSALSFFLSPILAESSNVFLIFLYYFINYFTIINLALAIFNLLPIFPLDGFNFIKSFMRPDSAFVQTMERYGSIILLVLIITPFFDWFYYFAINGILGGLDLFWGLF